LSNWKKLVVSGSQAHLASVTASNGSIISGSLTMSGSIVNVDYIDFIEATGNTVPAELPGRIYYDMEEDALTVYSNISDTQLYVGQEEHYLVKNNSGTTINVGQLVMFSGSIGNSGRLTAQLCDQTKLPSSVYVMGIAANTMNNGDDGFVINFGKVKGIDATGTPVTETWNNGDVLYVHPTIPGALTNQTPPGGKWKLIVAAVVNNTANGAIFVRLTPANNIGELDNVTDNSSTNGDLLIKSGSIWKNSKQLTGSYGVTGSLQATSFTGSLQGTASNAISSSYAVTSSFASSSPAVYDFGSFATPTDVGGGGNFGIVTDGDKGDITVTSSGSIWTIDSGSVTYAKIQNVTTSSVLLGRATTGAGNIEEIILGSGLTISGSTISAAGGGGGVQIQADIITTTQNWTMPAWAKRITVYLLPGGGGGGSGARQATTVNRCGGAGGAACGYTVGQYQSGSISSPVLVTIGAGGTSGSSVTTDTTNGNPGGNGGATSFGSLLATGVNGGGSAGNTTTQVNGGVAFGSTGLFITSTTFDGRRGTTTSGQTFVSDLLSMNTMGCGAGGAGAAANSTTTANGGEFRANNWTTIHNITNWGTIGTNGGSGGNGGDNLIGGYFYLNTSGGGGSYKTGQATGAGGNGGIGAGGGGGAASDNGFNSGAGGVGGDGVCIIISEG
jgi:hypothetical protein